MVFNSLAFALFLPIVYLLYCAIYDRQRPRDILLLIASYIFYMGWYWQYAGLLAISTIVDWLLSRKMDRIEEPRGRRILLLISLTMNLGLLATFKYFNFFSDLSAQTLGFFGMHVEPAHLKWLTPVGISFYTFQTLSYTIDVYRRTIKSEPSLLKFATFVIFFPQLVAGPIVRAADFLPQLNQIRKPTFENLQQGLLLIFIGLFKKIVIADLLAFLGVDAAFTDPSAHSSFDLLVALYGYAFQIYCDFSGYSDIAIGCALMFGFILPKNFDRPYISETPSEFWRRWHISLSSWLRDYLYISLGGNRGNKWFVVRNLMLTMLLGGLWHGAAMNFVLWGAYQGLLLVLTRNVATHVDSPWLRFGRIVCMFHFTLFGWLLFRISSMDSFIDYIVGLSHLSGGSRFHPLYFCLLALAALMHFVPVNWSRGLLARNIEKIPYAVQAAVYACFILGFVGFSMVEPNFIYFQF